MPSASKSDVTVVIPTIAARSRPHHGRASLLQVAVSSAWRQTTPPNHVIVRQDDAREGAAVNRQRALEEVETTWVAFLDDDDYLYGHHIGTLLDLVAGGDVDYAYSWFSGDQGPKPTLRGRQMDPRSPHPTCITVLVRTDLARVAGFTPPRDPGTLLGGEDWQFQLRCLALGARFAGTGEITWHYRRHHGRTGGMAWRTTAI